MSPFWNNACKVSIHAPARGATLATRRSTRRARVSIHAPARGATPSVMSTLIDGRSFNPRARERRDGLRRGVGRVDLGVSIHAPARGATRYRPAPLPDSTRFNPRAREGRDATGLAYDTTADVSIHAPARGATE